MFCVAVILLLPFCLARAALAQPTPEGMDAAQAKAGFAFAQQGEEIVAAVRLQLPAGYHAYAHETGGAGRPTTLTMRLADGQEASVLYPVGALQ
ncbi:MAG: hypothetical protein Q4F27_00695, partial [Desulfovibrionaceae bacterium]|nr:hypothetical protein [Desulfovibrionaceae bacterium]